MINRLKHLLAGLELEERILNGSALVGVLSVFLPWLSGEWLGEESVSYSGFEFFTSFIGILIFAMHVALLLIVLVPAFGGPVIVKRRHREVVRLCLASQATVLSIAALSVLTKVTYDYTRMEIRFGIYIAFISSILAAFYSFWRLQEQRKAGNSELFHHPDDQAAPTERSETVIPPPPAPPPPPPLEPEEHRIRP